MGRFDCGSEYNLMSNGAVGKISRQPPAFYEGIAIGFIYKYIGIINWKWAIRKRIFIDRFICKQAKSFLKFTEKSAKRRNGNEKENCICIVSIGYDW